MVVLFYSANDVISLKNEFRAKNRFKFHISQNILRNQAQHAFRTIFRIYVHDNMSTVYLWCFYYFIFSASHSDRATVYGLIDRKSIIVVCMPPFTFPHTKTGYCERDQEVHL